MLAIQGHAGPWMFERVPAQEVGMGCEEQHTPVRFAAWQREYEAAVLELDQAKSPALIRNARAAIRSRLKSLMDESCPAEKAAIANAVIFLDLLARGGAESKDIFHAKAS
jgi:hypothetical protein